MSNIQFEDSQNNIPSGTFQSQIKKGMVGWLMKKGIAKDEKTANFILIGVTIFFFVLTFVVAKVNNGGPTLSPEQIEASKQYFNEQIERARNNN